MTTASDQATRVRRTLEGVLGIPATEGNHIDVLRNGDEIFPAIFEAIERAEHTIDLLTFVYWEGTIGTKLAEALAMRARSGVRVRVLLDSFGARLIDPSSITLMEESDVQLRWFRPLRKLHASHANHRTHRKVLVIDEAIGFTGGVGIADEWQGDARDESEWRDTHFRIEGPAVDGLRAAFLDNWIETDPVIFDGDIDRFPHQPQAGNAVVQCVRGASETGWSDAATLFRSLLQLAQTHVRLTTAYFVPDEELTERICDAAGRGVKIQILLPGPHADKRIVQVVGESSYERLLECGVELWSFQPSMLHAKVMTVDSHIANVGSANLNSRSMALDEEINVVIIDDDVAATLDRHFDEDLERSIRIEPGRWDDRSHLQHAYERVARPLKRFF
jgi:cardiolipin synthase A/B